jgi:hypothetical protein
MNHALLPSVGNASLPAKYTAAKLALNECQQIDECKDWADKSAALASYAKQSGDKTLENTAMRIRARAVRRCGELLKEVEKANGANQNISRGAPTKVQTRMGAAERAGMSKDQAVTAIRVANLPDDSFEDQIESDEPPTITALAEQGRKPANHVPQYEKLGMTRQQFQAGMYFRGDVETYIAAMGRYDIEDIAAGSTMEERRQLKKNLEQIDKYNARLRAKL